MAKKFLPKSNDKNHSKKTKKKSPKTLPSGLPKKRKKRKPFIPILTDEAKLTPEEREKLHIKRSEAAKKAAKTRKENEAKLSPEEDEQQKLKRSEAAKKAAKTRKENEAKLSPEEREKLRSKRREQFLKNISKKKSKQTNETSEDIEEQMAWEKFDNFIAEINQGYNRNACDLLIECAREQANNYGVVDFMQAVEEKLNHDDLMVIVFADSLTEHVIISIQNVLEVIYSNSGISDYSFILEKAIEVESLIYADIYSRKYEDISQ